MTAIAHAPATPSRHPKGPRIGQLLGGHAALVVMSAIFVIPALALISTALKTLAQNTADPPEWIPHPIYWKNFDNAIHIAPVASMAANTVAITALTVLGATLSSAVVGYGFSLVRWRGQNAVFMVVIATMLIPYEVTLIPQYILFGKLGWLNTFYPLVVPYFFGLPIYIFLFRQFFLRLPLELGESARVDGASEFRIFSRVYLPLARPALLVVALLQLVASWNDFIGPLIYLNDAKLSTLVLGMEYFRQNQYQVDVGGQAAYSLIIIAPVVVIFFLGQRYFIEGIALSSVKG